MNNFDEVGVGTEDGSEVGQEVRPVYSEVGGEASGVGVFVRSVRVWGPYVETTFRRGGDEIGIGGGSVDLSAESEKGLGIVEPVGRVRCCHARESGKRSGVADASLANRCVGRELGKIHFNAIIKEGRGRERVGGAGKRAFLDRRKVSGTVVELSSTEGVSERNGGVSEETVLHSERLVDVGHFDGSTIYFKGFDNFASESGEVSGNRECAEGVEDEDARVCVDLVIEDDEIIVSRLGVSCCCRRDQRPRESERVDGGSVVSAGGGGGGNSLKRSSCGGGFQKLEIRGAGRWGLSAEGSDGFEKGVLGIGIADPGWKRVGR